MKKRFVSLILALAMFATLMPAALAAGADHDSCEFVELTREQYIASKAGALGISFEEAEALVDENIMQTLAMIPMPLDGFEATGGSTDQYGVNTAYGYIVYTKDVPNTARLLKVRMSVYAIVISGPPGRYVSEIGSVTNIPWMLSVMPGFLPTNNLCISLLTETRKLREQQRAIWAFPQSLFL